MKGQTLTILILAVIVIVAIGAIVFSGIVSNPAGAAYTVVYPGFCNDKTIYDSDGFNIYVQGYTQYYSSVKTANGTECRNVTTLDRCIGSTTVVEAVNKTTMTSICPSRRCANGACLNQTAPPYSNACKDSDGGNYPYAYGIVNGTDAYGRTITQTDQCGMSLNTSYVTEKFCTNISWSSEQYPCPYGCANGACQTCLGAGPIPASRRTSVCCPGLTRVGITSCINSTPRYNNTCKDSDGGKNYYVYGVLSGTTAGGSVINQSDYCSSYNRNDLFEHFCTNTSHSYENYLCPNGCEAGACCVGYGLFANGNKCCSGLILFSDGTCGNSTQPPVNYTPQ